MLHPHQTALQDQVPRSPVEYGHNQKIEQGRIDVKSGVIHRLTMLNQRARGRIDEMGFTITLGLGSTDRSSKILFSTLESLSVKGVFEQIGSAWPASLLKCCRMTLVLVFPMFHFRCNKKSEIIDLILG